MQFVAGLLAEKEGHSTDIFSDLLPSTTFTRKVEIKMDEDSEERSEILTCWPAFDRRQGFSGDAIQLRACMRTMPLIKKFKRNWRKLVVMRLILVSVTCHLSTG